MGGVDYYELLGVARTASTADIRTAYRALAKVMHPDAGGTAGTFQLLRQAYETLSDPALRADYDRAPAPPRTSHVPKRASRPRTFGADPNYVPPRLRLNRDSVPWWPTVNAPQRVRYEPSIGPSLPLVAVVLAAWLVLAGLTVLVPFRLIERIGLAILLAGTAYGVFRLTRAYVLARRADQEFLAEAGTLIVYGQPGTERDQLGEQLTARLLAEYVAPLPGVRIFHGLAWPGSVFADVDHAVLRGHRLVLIESKLWLPGHYEADEHGDVWRNGHPFRGGAIRLPEGIAQFRELLPGIEVRGVLIVHPSRKGDITTGSSPEVAAPPMSQERFVLEIGAWLAEQPAVVDRDAFRAILGCVVS